MIDFKHIENNIKVVEEKLEEGITDPVYLIELLLKDNKSMLNGLKEIRDMAATAEDPTVIEDIANLLGTTNRV